jgi:hypothetical protein
VTYGSGRPRVATDLLLFAASPIQHFLIDLKRGRPRAFRSRRRSTRAAASLDAPAPSLGPPVLVTHLGPLQRRDRARVAINHRPSGRNATSTCQRRRANANPTGGGGAGRRLDAPLAQSIVVMNHSERLKSFGWRQWAAPSRVARRPILVRNRINASGADQLRPTASTRKLADLANSADPPRWRPSRARNGTRTAAAAQFAFPLRPMDTSTRRRWAVAAGEWRAE